MLSSRNFMVLHFAFKSVIHFQFIFLKSKGLCLDSSFLCMNIQFSSTICWRECFHFIVLTAFAPVPKINWLLMGVYFRAVYSVLLIYWLVFSSIPYYLSFLKKIFKVYLFIYLFIYFWLCWVFVAAHRLSLVTVCRLLIALASLVAEHSL